MRARILVTASVCAAAILFAGCDLGPPEPQPEPAGKPDRAAIQQLVKEHRAKDRPANARDERSALAAFAEAWARREESGGNRALMRLSAGPLRDSLKDDPTRPAPDVAAQGQRLPSAETLEGITLRSDQPALVVTRITTQFEGDEEQESYSLYLADAEPVGRVWKVVQWTSAPTQ